MEPRIQYAKTADGVSIAYSVMGEGEPLVSMPAFPWSHIQLEWQVPTFRRLWERLAQVRRLVRYDARGTGSSDRQATDFSLEAHTLDLEAVINGLKLDRFALIGRANSALVAVDYAVRDPDRLTGLVLFTPHPGSSEVHYSSPRARAFRALRETDWRMLTETVAHEIVGWEEGEEARRVAAFLRECATQEVALAIINAADALDVTDLLAKVGLPTLVVGLSPPWWPPVEAARSVAARIPDARLVVMDRTPGVSAFEDTEAATRWAGAITEFLGEGEPSVAGAKPQEPSAFRTVLFTDIEGSTAMTQRLGDAKAREVMREHERITREARKAHGGSEVKTMGDGFMASFGSAVGALECAIAIQRAFAERNESAEEPMRVRVGLNAGEPIAEDDDLYGTAVNMAARICSRAEAGQILAPVVVRELAAGKPFMFADLGETELRGFEDPVRLYEVRWREEE